VIGHISLRNCFIKYYIALKKDGMFKVTGIWRKDTGIYRVIWRKWEGTGIWMRRQ